MAVHATPLDPGESSPPTRRMRAFATVPGLGIALMLGAIATGVGHLAPLLGAPVAGIVLGVVLSPLARARTGLTPGIKFASKFVLQLAVVVLGTQLSLGQVARAGVGSLPVMLGTMAVCLALAAWLGSRLGIGSDLRTLIGVGTAICGASAIAAVSPVVRAKGSDIAYAISTIFMFNVVAVLLYPWLGHLLGMSQHSFGLFAGTAINDTSSVVAAATTYGTSAGNYAVVVKLTRTLMIIPIVFAIAARVGRDGNKAESLRHPAIRALNLVPWFLIGFLLVAGANSLRVIPVSTHHDFQLTSLFLITVALSGIGLSTDFASLRRAGARPLLLGLLLWVAVGGTSLFLQWAT